MTKRAHKELVDLTAAWNRAIVSNDPGAIGSYMAEDWVIVGQSGIMEKSPFVGLVASGELTHEAMESRVIRVRFYHGFAVLTARGTNNGTYNGEPFASDEWITDVFVPDQGAWRCVLTHLTPAA